MNNSSIHNTSTRTDYALIETREKTHEGTTVKSPISKSERLIQLFNQIISSVQPLFLPPESFPLFVEDWRVCSRVKEILGMPQDQKEAWRDKPYFVRGLQAFKWLEAFETIIGKEFIEAKYIVGSAANYIVGQPVLREALEVFLSAIPDSTQKNVLRAKFIRAIAEKTFSFSDVDLRIKVKDDIQLGLLKMQIDEIDGCKTDLFDGKVLIVHISEFEGNALDIVIYKELNTESAFNMDDIKISITKSDLEKNIIALESVEPWKWWYGQLLGVLENNTIDPYYAFPRLESEICKGKVSLQYSESKIFPLWIEKINRKSKTEKEHPLKTQLDKQQEDHNRLVPVVDFLARLRIQQLIRDLSHSSYQTLREAANVDTDKSIPSWIKMLFQMMKEKGSDIEGIHALIEIIAALALYEAWKKPFEVKLIQHEEKWVLRLRFRGKFAKRDLLVRFNVPVTLEAFRKIKKEQSKKIRAIIHSLWFDGGLSERKVDSNYHKVLEDKTIFPIPLLPEHIKEIRKMLFSQSGPPNCKVVSLNDFSLASAEIGWSDNVDYLLEVGKIVLEHYNHDLTLRYQLCWRLVDKCIEKKGYAQATKMIKKLRKALDEPEEGYAALFAQVLQSNCDSYLLYQACSPFPCTIEEDKWLEFSQSKAKIPFIFKLLNEKDVSAELFLEMMRLLGEKKCQIEENILCKIIEYDRKKACERILKHDKQTFETKVYKELVSKIIVENYKSFDPIWIKNYIFSRRFEGSIEEVKILCEYLLSQSFTVQDKTTLLQTLGIKDLSLWQIVANEYFSQGEEWPESLKQEVNLDYESLVLWHRIIQKADDIKIVDETLQKIKPPKERSRDILRGLSLIRILKNWDTKPVSKEILNKILPLKAWETIIKGAKNGEDILKALGKVSRPLYCALFRSIKPKDEYYARVWLQLLEKDFHDDKAFLMQMKKPEMIDCLQINPKITLCIFKRLATDQEGVLFVLDYLTEPDQEIFYTMIKTCTQLKDDGVAGSKVFMKFYDSKIHKKRTEFPNHLAILAKNILKNPHGDTEAAVKMWKIVKDLAKPEKLPCKEHLVGMIRNSASEWVIQMLNIATPQELESVSPDVYRLLMSSVKEFKKRCEVLEGCRVFTKSIQRSWEDLARSNCLDPINASKLLNSAEKVQGSDSKVQRCALLVLCSTERNVIIEDHVLKYLLKMISRLDFENAYKLWDALRKSNRIGIEDLCASAINILLREPHNPHQTLLDWVLRHSSEQSNPQLFEFLSKTIQYPMEEKIQTIVLRFIKKEALKNNEKAKSMYWFLDCDESIKEDELKILCPTQEQCQKALNRLIEKSKTGSVSESMSHSIHCLWMEFGQIVIHSKEIADERKIRDIMYGLVIAIRHVYENEGKQFFLAHMCNLINDDLNECHDSKALMDIYRILIENSALVPVETLYKIAKASLEYTHYNFPDIWKILPPLAMSNNEEYLKLALKLYEKDQNFEKLTAKIVFQTHKFPKYIESFLRLILKNDDDKKHYLNGILLSAQLINDPNNKEIALMLIIHLDYMWRAFTHSKWQEEAEDWTYIASLSIPSEDMPIDKSVLSPSPILRNFFHFANSIFIKAKETIFFDPAVLKIFLEMLSHCSDNLPIIQISFLCMIIRSLRKNFDEYAAQEIIEFVFENVQIYKSGFSLDGNGCKVNLSEKDADFLSSLLTQMAYLIIEQFPSNNQWSQECYNRIMLFNKHCQRYENVLERNLIAYLALKADVNNLAETPVRNPAGTITKSIEALCATRQPNNHRKALQLLIIYTPEILIFFPESLKSCNKAYISATLDRINDVEVKKYIPQLFMHLSDTEMQADCFDMSEEKMQKFITNLLSGNGKYILNIKDKVSLKKIRQLQLELIHTNVVTILKAKPFLLHNMIDFLCTHTFLQTSKNYKENPESLQSLLHFLEQKCEKADTLAREKFAVLIATHMHIARRFLENRSPSFQLKSFYEQLNSARLYTDTLEGCEGDTSSLLWLRPIRTMPPSTLNLTENSIHQLSNSYHWCRITTESFQKVDPSSEEYLIWLQNIKNELILCLMLSSNIPPCRSLTINLLETFGKVIQMIAMMSKKQPEIGNCLLKDFLDELTSALNGKREWFSVLIIDKISEYMNEDLVPSLPFLEHFHENLSPLSPYRSCIDAYFNLLHKGCHNNSATVEKAIRFCYQLYHRIRLKPEDASNNYGNLGIFDEEQSLTFNIKFEFIYLAGFHRLLSNLEANKLKEKNGEIEKGISAEIFISELHNFRKHTDDVIKMLNGTNNLLPSTLLTKINLHLSVFTDNRAFKEIMELLMFLKQNIQMNQENNDSSFPETHIKLLLFSIFYQPDMRAVSQNIYLRLLSKIYVEDIADIDVMSWENSLFVKQTIKWVILEDPSNLSVFGTSIMRKSIYEKWFKDLFICSMKELIDELKSYKSIRRHYETSYDFWIGRIQTYTAQIAFTPPKK